MRHHAIDQLRNHAQVAEAAAPLATRRARLLRWAELMQDMGLRPLRPLMWVEFYSEGERRRLRRDDSPIAIAFADPALRAAGLTGDTLGEAQVFFGLSDRQAHELLCDCHYGGTMNGRNTAGRIKALASPGPIGWFMQVLRGV